MTQIQRILSNKDNLLTRAGVILTPSSVRTARAVRTRKVQRKGNGRVRLVGEYTGQQDTQIDVLIANGGGAVRASVPVFTGVGNGALTVEHIDPGTPEQNYTVTLTDLGTPTQTAQLAVKNVILRAKTPGETGNNLSITVTPVLSQAATKFSLLEGWSAGTASQTGDQWNFGSFPLTQNGEIAEATPRLKFGADPTIYREYKTYKDGDWHYSLSPALERDLPKGAPVYTVTGGYTVTLSNGVASETYPNLITFYDFLAALGGSALIEVAGVVANDKTPGAQGAVDVALKTSSYIVSVTGPKKLEALALRPDAPTETISIKCGSAEQLGLETWTVSGAVSGLLGTVKTGQVFNADLQNGPISFKVPMPESLGTPDTPEGAFNYTVSLVGRSEEEYEPVIKLDQRTLGKSASPKSVTFVLRRHPPADCVFPAVDPVSMFCLGLYGEGGELLDPALKTRLEALYKWRSESLDLDFSFGNGGVGSGKFPISPDAYWIDPLVITFQKALEQILSSPTALAMWDNYLVEAKEELGTFFTNDSASRLYQNAENIKDVGDEIFSESLYSKTVPLLNHKYGAKMDRCLIEAGISPKPSASTDQKTSADGCWQDFNDAWWWVDTTGYYMPVQTNRPYVSCHQDAEGKITSTQEFGFQMRVACPERLKLGDAFTINIQTTGEKSISVNDEYLINVVHASPSLLAGGVTGTDTLTWQVVGSVSGSLPALLQAGSPTLYAGGGLNLTLHNGGIPFALGDQFQFAVSSAQFQWRQDGGAWSALQDVPNAGDVPLVYGISAQFEPGAAPSYGDGDAYTFEVLQPYSHLNVLKPSDEAWQWQGDTPQLEIDLGSVQTLNAVALAQFNLPAGAVFEAFYSEDGLSFAHLALTHTETLALALFAQPIQARYLRITSSQATGGQLGWVWAGMAWSGGSVSAICTPTRKQALSRAQGYNARALFAGRGTSWQVEWDKSLDQKDAEGLAALADYAAEKDEPVILVPHILHAQEAALVRWPDDALEIVDGFGWQPDDSERRRISATLNLEAVVQ